MSSHSVQLLNVLSQCMHFPLHDRDVLSSVQYVASFFAVLCFARAPASRNCKYHEARCERSVAEVAEAEIASTREHFPGPIPVPAGLETCLKSPARECVGRKMKERQVMRVEARMEGEVTKIDHVTKWQSR
jgi:hypothetical protein